MPFVKKQPDQHIFPTPVEDSKPAAEAIAVQAKPKERYYRVRKITGFLAELLEVEVDEVATPPSRVGKQDTMEMVLGKASDYLWVHPDNKRLKKR